MVGGPGGAGVATAEPELAVAPGRRPAPAPQAALDLRIVRVEVRLQGLVHVRVGVGDALGVPDMVEVVAQRGEAVEHDAQQDHGEDGVEHVQHGSGFLCGRTAGEGAEGARVPPLGVLGPQEGFSALLAGVAGRRGQVPPGPGAGEGIAGERLTGPAWGAAESHGDHHPHGRSPEQPGEEHTAKTEADVQVRQPRGPRERILGAVPCLCRPHVGATGEEGDGDDPIRPAGGRGRPSQKT